MVIADDTQPKRPTGLVTPPPYDPYGKDKNLMPMQENEGPGCWLWGIMLLFSSVLAVAVVLLAIFAVQIGQATKTAKLYQEVQTQCNLIQQEVAAMTPSFINVRIVSLQTLTPAPDCLATVIPAATALAQTLQPTVTPTFTGTPTFTATVEAPQITPSAAAPQATTSTTGGTQFDPVPLLEEARLQISTSQWAEAADTLDAVMAIDPNYEAATVKQLMYQALTSQARGILASPTGNLAEAIVIINRAGQYGNIANDPLNYERAVAQTYLDAVAAKGSNYPEAIRLFNQVLSMVSDPNYHDARNQLIDQYTKYGDALAIGGQNCEAVPQYQAALDMTGNSALQTKIDAATLACSQGAVATLDPNQPTPDPNQAVVPTDSGVAPIGQQ